MIKKTLYPKTTRQGHNTVTMTEKLDGSNISFFKSEGELFIAQRNNIFKFDDLMTTEQSYAYKGLLGWLEKYGQQLKEMLNDNACISGEWLGMGKLDYGSDFSDGRFFMFAKGNIEVEDNDHIAEGFKAQRNVIFFDEFTEVADNAIAVYQTNNINKLVKKDARDRNIKFYDAVVGNVQQVVDKLTEDNPNQKIYVHSEIIHCGYSLIKLNYDQNNFAWSFVGANFPEFIKVVPIVYTGKPMTLEELDEFYQEYCDATGRSVEGFIIINGGNIKKYVRMKNGSLADHLLP